MHTMSAQELKDALDREEDLVLINVLDQGPFEKEHIPNSQNIPVSDEQFEQKVQEAAGRKNRKVVLYCASTECDASPTAAQKLQDAGFTNVHDFDGGTREWKEAGFEVASGSPAATA